MALVAEGYANGGGSSSRQRRQQSGPTTAKVVLAMSILGFLNCTAAMIAGIVAMVAK